MKDEKKSGGCCSCEADFEKQVKKSVDQVENYTEKDREKKEAEVEAAFKSDDQKKEVLRD